MRISKEDVEKILGRGTVDDRTITDIIATGASDEELAVAYSRMVTDLPAASELPADANIRVSRLCAILEEIVAVWDEETAAGT